MYKNFKEDIKMDQPVYVKKKLVTVRCANPFSFNKIPFVGICNKVTLDVEAINYALMHKAKVVEHLSNGKEVLLGFDNYNTYNGPTTVTDSSESFKFTEPEIEMVDGMGNHTVINKKANKKQQEVRHIDLEAIKAKQKEEEDAKKALELQRQHQIERDRKAAELKAMKERDKKAREEAAAKILADAQAKADKASGVATDITNKESYSYDFPGTISAEIDFTNSDKQENKKTTYDSKKDKKK